jgi:acyl-homoserine lactone acylase PvdQ
MVDTAEVTAVPAPSDGDVLHEPIVIKGRAAPFVFDTTVTPRGLVIAADRAHHVAYALRWSGFEPGAAAELAALAVDRARDWDGFRAALGRWKMPVRRLVYADVDGNVGVQEAGLVPVRRGANWIGWRTLDDLPHAFNPASGTVPSSAAVAPARPDASAVFAHVLGITRAARERFDIGPVARPADDAVVRAELVPRNWDRSRAMSAPGQSESPSSAHFRDLVDAWSAGGSIPLAFTDDAVQRAAASTLVLVPAGQGDPVAGRGGGGQKRSPYFTR